jgi:hypothetical protein
MGDPPAAGANEGEIARSLGKDQRPIGRQLTKVRSAKLETRLCRQLVRLDQQLDGMVTFDARTGSFGLLKVDQEIRQGRAKRGVVGGLERGPAVLDTSPEAIQVRGLYQ